MRRYWLAILIPGVLLTSVVKADGGSLSGETTCGVTDAQQGCVLKRSPKDVLRALRLKNAVLNGDMTEDEAKKQAPQLYDVPPSFAPNDNPQELSPEQDQARRRFWREQRRRSLNQSPFDPVPNDADYPGGTPPGYGPEDNRPEPPLRSFNPPSAPAYLPDSGRSQPGPGWHRRHWWREHAHITPPRPPAPL
jgi:hypothetical protein